MPGIDDIVEMVLKEARERDRKNLFKSIVDVIAEIMDKCNWIVVERLIDERRKKLDENKGRNFKQCR